jgi:hypothetical protein
MNDVSHPDAANHESRLDQAIAAYLAAEDAGNPPVRDEFLGDHADIADCLRAFFRDHDRLGRLARPLQAAADPAADAVDIRLRTGRDPGVRVV